MSTTAPTLPRPAVPAGAGARLPEALFGEYRAISSGYDEMLGREGTIQPHYRPLISWLEGLSTAERDARFRSARQYLAEAGVFYRVYGDPERAGEPREWPLAQPPLVIAQKEWEALERGLVQRARLLEATLADLYGERRLVSDGTLPAALIARNPEFLRPLAAQGLGGAPLLHFVAFDLGRGPDGRWWVLGDRTQAPSGAGFALENRVATSRAFPDLIGEMRSRRIAGFFSQFRDALSALPGRGGQRIGLTPGPHNETYFEHAYLARYLGMLLLEGGDLVVHGERAEVRTVDGFQPINVLWRRLDADFADPLELFSGSRIGTPGLLRAVRAGNLRIVNALGSGLVEAKALLPFGQALARRLLGEDLALPVIATWWCGEESASGFVRRHAGDLVLGPAFPRAAGAAPPGADETERLLQLDGARVVGQEIARLSTAPVFEDGRLVPRPVTLRVFLARDADGWHVMPGGFARVADQGQGDPRALSMQSGGRSMDVWISGEAAPQAVTLIGGGPDERFQRRLPGALPARAADNLYWLGRYVERCEVGTRLLRLHSARRAASEKPGPLDARLARLLSTLGIDVFSDAPARGLADLAAAAASTASRIRERFSPDGWRVLAEIVEVIESTPTDAPADELVKLTSRCLTRLAGFTGLVNENMYQFAGWRFLSIGRRLERGQMTARITAALAGGGEPPEGALEALLEFADSRITYRRRYSVSLSRQTVLDLVVLDPLNPRSVAFQVNDLGALFAELPGFEAGQSPAPLARRSARLRVRLQTADAAEADTAFLERIARDLSDVSDLLTAQFLLGSPGRERPPSDTE